MWSGGGSHLGYVSSNWSRSKGLELVAVVLPSGWTDNPDTSGGTCEVLSESYECRFHFGHHFRFHICVRAPGETIITITG